MYVEKQLYTRCSSLVLHENTVKREKRISGKVSPATVGGLVSAVSIKVRLDIHHNLFEIYEICFMFLFGLAHI